MGGGGISGLYLMSDGIVTLENLHLCVLYGGNSQDQIIDQWLAIYVMNMHVNWSNI